MQAQRWRISQKLNQYMGRHWRRIAGDGDQGRLELVPDMEAGDEGEEGEEDEEDQKAAKKLAEEAKQVEAKKRAEDPIQQAEETTNVGEKEAKRVEAQQLGESQTSSISDSPESNEAGSPATSPSPAPTFHSPLHPATESQGKPRRSQREKSRIEPGRFEAGWRVKHRGIVMDTVTGKEAGVWYHGRIVAVHADSFVDVHFDDGELRARMAPSSLYCSDEPTLTSNELQQPQCAGDLTAIQAATASAQSDSAATDDDYPACMDDGVGEKRRKARPAAFRGVGVLTAGVAWYARICHQGKQERLGNFASPQEAARAYDRRARQLGKSELNFPDGEADSQLEDDDEDGGGVEDSGNEPPAKTGAKENALRRRVGHVLLSLHMPI